MQQLQWRQSLILYTPDQDGHSGDSSPMENLNSEFLSRVSPTSLFALFSMENHRQEIELNGLS